MNTKFVLDKNIRPAKKVKSFQLYHGHEFRGVFVNYAFKDSFPASNPVGFVAFSLKNPISLIPKLLAKIRAPLFLKEIM